MPPTAQAQDPAAPTDSVSLDRIISYTFANDAAFRTDYYFTQGMTLTLVHPLLRQLPVRKLLLRRAATTSYYGLRLSYDGFTPLRIQDAFIRYGDRPYASYLYATLFRLNNSEARRQRLTAGLSVGVIGPAAGAKGFQTKLHALLDAPTPRGWDYQVRNDLVLGYAVRWEQQLLTAGRVAELIGTAEATLGTMHTLGGAGLLLRAGKLNPYFQNMGVASRPNRNSQQAFQLYAQGEVGGRLVGYDATLQGGVFNQTSPYTLNANQVTRTVAQGTGSVVAAYSGLRLRTSVTWISPEFKGARRHAWTQLALDVAF